MSSGLARVAEVAKKTGQSVVSVFQGVDSSITQAAKDTKKIADNLGEVDKKARGAGYSLKSLARGLGIGLSIGSLVAFAKDSLGQSAEAENQKIAFKVLLGNKFKGDALYSQIRQMADTTPYESKELMQAGKMLLGFGEKQGRIMPDLKSLGDIAAAQDSPTQALLGLSHAYGEVIASGRLLGRNTLEMINWGFNPLKEISLMTGKSMGELKKAEEQGAISADMVRKAFQHATSAGGKYNDMMKEQAQTLGGQWSTFMDLVHAKMRAFGDELAPSAKQLMALGTKLLGFGAKSEVESFVDETARLQGLRNELQLTNLSNQRRLEIFQQLKASYPGLVDNIKTEKDALEKLIPTLDAYIGKRFLGSGVLKIKEKFADDLTAVEELRNAIGTSNAEAIGKASYLAGKYNIDVRGKSAGQLEMTVLNHLKQLEGTNPTYKDGIGLSNEHRDWLSLHGSIVTNAQAIKEYQLHLPGANKANEAIAQFNKVMGIDTPKTGGSKSTNPYGDSDSQANGEDVTGGIARGGPRVININGGVRFADKVDMHVADFKGGVEQVEPLFHEMLLRVLQSGASVQQ